MEKLKEEYEINSNLNILQFALKRWKILAGVAIVAGILAAVFSGPQFISPLYTSNAVVFPANLGEYSEENGLEQMQQYLESNKIRDSIIAKFNLYDEYEIDSTAKTSRNRMIKTYNEFIGFGETKFESIKITASSTDPVKAKLIVDNIIELLNHTIRETERLKYFEVMNINKMLLDQKKSQIDSLENLIKEYSMKYGILEYMAQSEEVTEGYMKFLLAGKKGKEYEEAKRLYDNLGEHGRKYHDFHAQLNYALGDYAKRLDDYELALKDYNKKQTYTNVLVEAEVPDKKSYPIRWLIVVTAISASVLFTFIVLLLFGYQLK